MTENINEELQRFHNVCADYRKVKKCAKAIKDGQLKNHQQDQKVLRSLKRQWQKNSDDSPFKKRKLDDIQIEIESECKTSSYLLACEHINNYKGGIWTQQQNVSLPQILSTISNTSASYDSEPDIDIPLSSKPKFHAQCQSCDGPITKQEWCMPCIVKNCPMNRVHKICLPRFWNSETECYDQYCSEHWIQKSGPNAQYERGGNLSTSQIICVGKNKSYIFLIRIDPIDNKRHHYHVSNKFPRNLLSSETKAVEIYESNHNGTKSGYNITFERAIKLKFVRTNVHLYRGLIGGFRDEFFNIEDMVLLNYQRNGLYKSMQDFETKIKEIRDHIKSGICKHHVFVFLFFCTIFNIKRSFFIFAVFVDGFAQIVIKFRISIIKQHKLLLQIIHFLLFFVRLIDFINDYKFKFNKDKIGFVRRQYTLPIWWDGVQSKSPQRSKYHTQYAYNTNDAMNMYKTSLRVKHIFPKQSDRDSLNDLKKNMIKCAKTMKMPTEQFEFLSKDLDDLILVGVKYAGQGLYFHIDYNFFGAVFIYFVYVRKRSTKTTASKSGKSIVFGPPDASFINTENSMYCFWGKLTDFAMHSVLKAAGWLTYALIFRQKRTKKQALERHKYPKLDKENESD